ncbi:NAD(P)-dependent alcohol dehydrogenase [Agromyces ramosus]|uniref:NADPH:quinone reductase-like Zn-dependent oxidoreductase n=1 Tax=Agromyces ramosus TaxID=33879 RepID=A0ABU0R361_9MICO|nr:NAD(P)-dependent alcohol dehydrogenase [Agromyces ramosus]MDQ0892516.1 NADPH:quinone reductase-like Zn-dependent oxidoreductase [Agromyces ramosus]
MRAVVYDRYGPPEHVLRLEELDPPSIGEHEVLVRVRAASVNSWDCDNLLGRPFLTRAGWGLRRPKRRVLGADVAGDVVAAGRGVTRFRPGDLVFGDLSASNWGGFAEFASAPEHALERKPAGLPFEQAAAIPQAGVMALQAVGQAGGAGRRALVNGAGGGVGTFAIQLLRASGTHVTGVDSAEKLDLMRSLGAETVIDYTRENVADRTERFDLIIDVIARRSMFDYKRLLAPGGRYIMIGGATSRIAQVLLFGAWEVMTRSSRSMGLLVHRPNHDLERLGALAAQGALVPVIGRTFELAEVAEAMRMVIDGRALGKVVVTIA